MAPKIREDLVIPYRHVPAKPRDEASGMITQALPMAAMFMRNKLLSWSALFIALQSYLNEPSNKVETSEGSQPPLLRVLFAIIALATCYLDLLFPKYGPGAQKARQVVSTASSTLSSIASTATK